MTSNGPSITFISNSCTTLGHRYIADRTNKFTVVLEHEEEGGFTVRVPLLPEIVTYGDDEQEALVMAEDAIRLVIEDCIARGEPAPNPRVPRVHEISVTHAA